MLIAHLSWTFAFFCSFMQCLISVWSDEPLSVNQHAQRKDPVHCSVWMCQCWVLGNKVLLSYYVSFQNRFEGTQLFLLESFQTMICLKTYAWLIHRCIQDSWDQVAHKQSSGKSIVMMIYNSCSIIVVSLSKSNFHSKEWLNSTHTGLTDVL